MALYARLDYDTAEIVGEFEADPATVSGKYCADGLHKVAMPLTVVAEEYDPLTQRQGTPVYTYTIDGVTKTIPAVALPSEEAAALVRQDKLDRGRIIAPLDFLERFTAQERAMIRAASAVNDDLADYFDMVRTAREIDLDDDRTVTGVAMLAAAELIASGRDSVILS